MKRGTRRTGLNGNGQSSLPPVFGATTRYTQAPPPRRSRRTSVLRGFGWFALVLAVVGAGIGGGVYLYLHESLDAISTHTGAGKHASTLISAVPTPSQPAIALVAGYDHRAGTGTSASAYAGSNSDTLMLLRADPKNDTLSLLSFPRDLNVPIYCKGNVVSTSDRINAAWADCGSNGGPYAAVDTVEHLTRLKINYLITLDFNAFKQIVNKLHGVYINVDRRYYNPPHNGSGWSAINLRPGYQKLDGGQALSYVRFRHLDSDIYRNGRQQLFMEAIKSRVKSELSITNLTLLTQLMGALKGNLEVIKAGGAALNFGEVQRYLNLVYKLPAGHLFRNSIPLADLSTLIVNGADELQATPGSIPAAVHSFLNPNVPKVQPKTTPKSGGHKTKAPARKDVSVLVLNASNVTGEAANTSVSLKRQGFATKQLPTSIPANAPQLKRPTIVFYDPQQPLASPAAEELAPLFGAGTKVMPMTPAIASLAAKAHKPLTVVAIGESYGGKLKLPHTGGSSGPSASKAAAQVTNGVPITLSALQAENGPARFPLMVPHQLAAGSTISSDEGVRLFKPLRGKQELVLSLNVYGGVEYYNIEESNWTTEPLLQSPTAHFTYNGQTYYEYTSGGAIQVIALRTKKAVYWVTNSILNELSNATMIAIAESLRPLR